MSYQSLALSKLHWHRCISNPCAPHRDFVSPSKPLFSADTKSHTVHARGPRGDNFCHPVTFSVEFGMGTASAGPQTWLCLSVRLSSCCLRLEPEFPFPYNSRRQAHSNNSHGNSAKWLVTEVQPALEGSTGSYKPESHAKWSRGEEGTQIFFFSEEYGKFILANILFHESRGATLLCQKLGSLKAHNSTLVQQLY